MVENRSVFVWQQLFQALFLHNLESWSSSILLGFLRSGPNRFWSVYPKWGNGIKKGT